MAMPASLLGPGLVLVFGLSQAVRDVYFAGLFQGIDVFVVILLAFSISTVLFGLIALIRAPEELAILGTEWRAMLWMNITTALAWTAYFYSLAHLQPSIVNTLHSGVGPLTVVVLSALGLNIARPGSVRRAEHACHAGIAASLAFLWWVVLSGRSGLAGEGIGADLAALALLLVSGCCITISLLLSKRMNERGVGANAVSAGRYLLLIAVAFCVVAASDTPTGIGGAQAWAMLAGAATLLIVLPLYSLQVGVKYTVPLTAHVIRSLGPVFVFLLELFDGRIAYSQFTLLGIALYSVFSIAANLAHGWRERAVSLRPSGAA
jgi:drug/metabolite transporter (DMT)-like permease